MQSTSAFRDIAKYVDFRKRKNAAVNKNKGVCHVINKFLRSSLGKV